MDGLECVWKREREREKRARRCVFRFHRELVFITVLCVLVFDPKEEFCIIYIYIYIHVDVR